MGFTEINPTNMDLLNILTSLIINTHDIKTEQRLEKVAEERIRQEKLDNDRRELDNRVQDEAKRLQVGSDKYDVIRDIIITFGDDYRTALAVAKAESGLRCEAYHFNDNGTVDSSVFQLNSVHKKRGNLADCKENIKIAKQIVDEQGWSPWVVYWKGTYKKWLN